MTSPLSPSSFLLLLLCLTSLHTASSLRLPSLLLPQPASAQQKGADSLPLTTQLHASGSGPGNVKGANTPLKEGHISGSGFRFRFSAKPGGSYCVLSDPCIHVNAILADVPSNATETWVDSVVVKSGQSTLVLSGLIQGGATSPGIAITLDGESAYDIVMDQRVAEGKHGAMFVDLWKSEPRAGVLDFMVTARACNVRLLLSVRGRGAGDAKAPSHQRPADGTAVSIEVLDWARLRQAMGMFPTGIMSSEGGDEVLDAMRRSGERGGPVEVSVAGSSEYLASTPQGADCKCSRFAAQAGLRKNV